MAAPDFFECSECATGPRPPQQPRAIEHLSAASLATHTGGMTRQHEVDRFSSVQAAGRAIASSRLFRGNYRPIASETAPLRRTRGGRVPTLLGGR